MASLCLVMMLGSVSGRRAGLLRLPALTAITAAAATRAIRSLFGAVLVLATVGAAGLASAIDDPGQRLARALGRRPVSEGIRLGRALAVLLRRPGGPALLATAVVLLGAGGQRLAEAHRLAHLGLPCGPCLLRAALGALLGAGWASCLGISRRAAVAIGAAAVTTARATRLAARRVAAWTA